MANELALPDALAYEPVRNLVSRIKVRNAVFQNFYLVGPGQANTEQLPGDEGQTDIFDNARDPAKATAAGADYPQDKPDPIGKFNYTCIRGALERRFHGLNLARLRQIGGPDTLRDAAGRAYFARQLMSFMGKFATLREMALVGMFRGGFYLKPSGLDLIPTFTSTGAIQVNYQIPAGHTGQLNWAGAGAIIGASWYAAGTSILSDKDEIFEASESESGELPTTWWWNYTTWRSSTYGNTELRAVSGTGNDIVLEKAVDPEINVTRIILRAMPEVTHYIYSGVVNIDGTITKYIPDEVVIMTPDPKPGQTWLTGIEGSDYYGPVEDGLEPVEANGQFFYNKWLADKSSAVMAMRGNDLFIPRLAVPKAIWVADVVP